MEDAALTGRPSVFQFGSAIRLNRSFTLELLVSDAIESTETTGAPLHCSAALSADNSF